MRKRVIVAGLVLLTSLGNALNSSDLTSPEGVRRSSRVATVEINNSKPSLLWGNDSNGFVHSYDLDNDGVLDWTFYKGAWGCFNFSKPSADAQREYFKMRYFPYLANLDL
jgi:hypothetical protein